MVVVAFFSFQGDSLTTDESPHISAGYSYLTQKDMRLNPEHPPLVKDVSAIPLLFQDINFPSTHPSWSENINDQWAFGPELIFNSENNSDKIMNSARTAMLLFLILLGIYIFKWAKERYGGRVALVALFFFALSPTFLAHGRLVTTDVAAAFGFVFSFYYFFKFLKTPNRKNIILAGLSFGVAQLLKFSLILLIPFYGGIFFVYWLINRDKVRFWRYFGFIVLIFLIGFILVWPVYQYHVWNYPPDLQVRDTAHILSSSQFKFIADKVVWMADKPFLRPYAQYGLGLLMVFQRTTGGNTTFFMGDVASTAWKSYFPVVFGLKVPLALILLMLLSLWVGFKSLINNKINLKNAKRWLRDYFVEFGWLAFVIFYWALSVFGNLNIGIRHVLPTFPFIYLLVSGQIQKWRREKPLKIVSRSVFLTMILLWYGAVSLFTFPFFLVYFNEVAGGPDNGHNYVVDSNLDWGQDLKRLARYVEENNIQKIKLDYFGGDSPFYRLGNKYEKFDLFKSERKGWIAVSATLLQNGRGEATKKFDKSTNHYKWLNNYEPVAKIGYSIFVYNIE